MMGKKDVLVVSAHAADYCTRAGGTIAKYVKEGYKVHIIALTYGCRGESGNYWQENPAGTEQECAAIRHRESQAAADYLGATIEFCGYNDYPLTMDESRIRHLTRRYLDIRPEIVLTHNISDPTNVDHELAAQAVIKAVTSGAQLGAFPETGHQYFPNLFFFESTVPYSEFNDFKPDTYINIDDTFDTKLAAIRKFECQPQLADFYIHFARHRGFQVRSFTKQPVTYAEAFKRYFPFAGDLLPETKRYL